MIEINRIYTGDCIEVMKTWPENFVDTIITDPPYGIRFMGKAWDGEDIERTVQQKRRKTTTRPDCQSLHDGRAFAAGTYDLSITGNTAFQLWCTEWAAAALRIVKPGGMMLVFGGTRTFHRMAAGIEDAGWQIRDCLMWLYGSGFPKSLDISKAIDKAKGAERKVMRVATRNGNAERRGDGEQGATFGDAHGGFTTVSDPVSALAKQWNGWGTALKPAWEPIIVAMKPLDGTFAENAEKWGVAGINVDGGRIGTNKETPASPSKHIDIRCHGKYGAEDGKASGFNPNIGRWPANLILDEEAAKMLDGQSIGQMHSAGHARDAIRKAQPTGMWAHAGDGHRIGDSGGASRFFYVAKADRAERNEGCDGMEAKPSTKQFNEGMEGKIRSNGTVVKPPILQQNHHPTVKPLSLMKYLCNLTRTPAGGIVLDPFSGSGTTLWAAEYHNRPWIGIEMNPEYVAIAEARLARERSQVKMAI